MGSLTSLETGGDQTILNDCLNVHQENYSMPVSSNKQNGLHFFVISELMNLIHQEDPMVGRIHS